MLVLVRVRERMSPLPSHHAAGRRAAAVAPPPAALLPVALLPIAPLPIAPRHAPTRPEEKMAFELLPSLACTSARGTRQSGRAHGKVRGRAGARVVRACAPLHAEEEYVVHHRRLQDDVVVDSTDIVVRRVTPHHRQKKQSVEGLPLDHAERGHRRRRRR